jgi:protocatechuate 3,4-dioxygenase beta subunit
MRTVTPDTITEVFTGYLGPATDPRTREIFTSLTKHLHGFVREVGLTHDEWRKGLEAMEWAGRITTPDPNEFGILSDVMGLSSLVDMINSRADVTSSSVLGPFHVSDAPPLKIGGDRRGDFKEEVLLVTGHVRDKSGEPIAEATIDIWQTAPNGLYSSQDPDQDIMSFHGLMTADAQGYYGFTTVRPVSDTGPTDGPVGKILTTAGRNPWRPSHLHFIVTAPGFRSLVTEVFPSDDPYLDQDTVFGVRDDLIMTYLAQPEGRFPEGFALSGKVPGPFAKVEFDFFLASD